jgi:hypothetical protein
MDKKWERGKLGKWYSRSSGYGIRIIWVRIQTGGLLEQTENIDPHDLIDWVLIDINLEH